MYAIFLKCFRKAIVCVFVLERENKREKMRQKDW